MKIIKQGKNRCFKCPKCRCKFEASPEEYSLEYDISYILRHNGIYYIYTVNCPYCNFRIQEKGYKI